MRTAIESNAHATSPATPVDIKREEDKVKTSLKSAAKSKNREACLILAKELVNSRKAVKRLNLTKAQIKSVEMSIQQQAGSSSPPRYD